MLATMNIIAGLLSLVNVGIPQCKAWSCRAISISSSAARQTFVYTKNSSRKYYVICRGECQIRLHLQLHAVRSLLWGICSLLDSGLLATAVEVSKSCHNLTIKLLIQNPPISFQDNTALSLHCMFQTSIFSDHGENANSYLVEWLTHTHRMTTVCLRAQPTEA